MERRAELDPHRYWAPMIIELAGSALFSAAWDHSEEQSSAEYLSRRMVANAETELIFSAGVEVRRPGQQYFEAGLVAITPKRLYFDAGAALIGRKMRFEFPHRKSEYYFQEVDLPNLDHLFVACKGRRVYEIVAEEETYAAFDEMIERQKQDRENAGFFRSLLNRLR